jgi:hypothetical protein
VDKALAGFVSNGSSVFFIRKIYSHPDGHASTNTRTFALFILDPAIQIAFPKKINPAPRRQGLGKINEIYAALDPHEWPLDLLEIHKEGTVPRSGAQDHSSVEQGYAAGHLTAMLKLAILRPHKRPAPSSSFTRNAFP